MVMTIQTGKFDTKVVYYRQAKANAAPVAAEGNRMQADPTVMVAARLDHYGTIGVFSFIAGAMLIVFVVIAAFAPAVTKHRLEVVAT
jgi:hypothetical protein